MNCNIFHCSWRLRHRRLWRKLEKIKHLTRLWSSTLVRHRIVALYWDDCCFSTSKQTKRMSLRCFWRFACVKWTKASCLFVRKTRRCLFCFFLERIYGTWNGNQAQTTAIRDVIDVCELSLESVPLSTPHIDETTDSFALHPISTNALSCYTSGRVYNMNGLNQLCPTQMAYWTKNYAIVLTRAVHWQIIEDRTLNGLRWSSQTNSA